MKLQSGLARTDIPWLPTLLAGLCLPSATHATRPENPLPPGLYTFDRQSPVVQGGLVNAADILTLQNDDFTVVHPADALGLASPLDEIDGLSTANSSVGTGDSMIVLISVNRGAQGGIPPDPVLVGAGIPYNVQDQASRGHQAGDQYMALSTFTRAAGPAFRGLRTTNTVLTRNNFNEGGTGYAATPYVPANATTPGAPQDNVNSMAQTTTAARRVAALYFSLTNDSPSLDHLSPNMAHGANIFYDNDLTDGGNEQVYAFAQQLGLVPGDEVNGLVVFDDGNGFFDGTDRVLFSLAPGSPSLSILMASPADVLSIMPGPGTSPVPLVTAADLGLAAMDDVDAVDFFICSNGVDPVACALERGIREPFACDWDHDGQVTHADLVAMSQDCYSGPSAGVGFTPPSAACLETFDGDEDEDVDLWDFGFFQFRYTRPPGP